MVGGKRQRQRQKQREKEKSICCATYLCTHWLILVCLDQAYQDDSNQLNYPARGEE